MYIVRILLRNPLRQMRQLSLCSTINQSAETAAQPQQQTVIENLTIPPPSSVDRPISPKIQKLIDEISKLTLLEVSELSGGLKKHLNLPDAPVFPAGGFVAAAPGAASQEEEEEAEKPKAKTTFTVKLVKYDETQKVPLIKEIKGLIEGMNLVQAKKFVEGIPAVIKEDVNKEDAEKLQQLLEKVGGKVTIE